MRGVRRPTLAFVLVMVLTGSAVLGPAQTASSRHASPPQPDEEGAQVPLGAPCDRLPGPPGRAEGHDRRCPPEGSGAGVARGDFNGDGFADLAIGVPLEDIGTAQDAGAVHVLYGSANGLTSGGGTTGIPAAQFWRQGSAGVDDSPEAFDRFGTALAAGRFNADAYSDLAIGVPDEDIEGLQYSGAVHILFGSANGLTATGEQFWSLAAFPPEFPPSDTRFGAALAWGDFNGDTIGDLAVGIPGAQSTCNFPGARVLGCFVADAGRVLVLFGASNGPGTFGRQFILQDHGLDLDFIEVGDVGEGSDRFGSVLAAGDFDGDRFDDLVVGVPREDLEPLLAPAIVNAGAVHIAFGSAGGLGSRKLSINQDASSPPGLSIPNDPKAGNQLGRALAVGDFDGDALADLAMGAPFEDVGTKSNAGVAYVLYGVNIGGGLQPASAEMWHQNVSGIADGAATSDHFGMALAAGDFDADGRSDFAIGVPDEDVTDSNGVVQADAGAVHIIYGTASGLHEAGDRFIEQDDLGVGRTTEAGDRFGASLASWNFGRNEIRHIGTFPFIRIIRTADLAIAAPGEDLSNAPNVTLADVGVVSVLYGHSQGRLTLTDNQFWHQNLATGVATPPLNEAGDRMEAGDQFGAALY